LKKLVGLLAIGLALAAMQALSPQTSAAQGTTIMPNTPTLTDAYGKLITVPTTGRQMVVSYSFRNFDDKPRDFLGLFEVRNSDGVTELLAWQTGTMPPVDDQGIAGTTSMGVSWQPDKASTYQMRIFTLSNLEKPESLSAPVTSEITVSESED